jgi:murein L,D-transpeptidase YafK
MLQYIFIENVILVEKSTHSLYVYENQSTEPVLVKQYKIATGKIKGDKASQGDHRTPEGIYHILDFYPETRVTNCFFIFDS